MPLSKIVKAKKSPRNPVIAEVKMNRKRLRATPSIDRLLEPTDESTLCTDSESPNQNTSTSRTSRSQRSDTNSLWPPGKKAYYHQVAFALLILGLLSAGLKLLFTTKQVISNTTSGGNSNSATSISHLNHQDGAAHVDANSSLVKTTTTVSTATAVAMSLAALYYIRTGTLRAEITREQIKYRQMTIVVVAVFAAGIIIGAYHMMVGLHVFDPPPPPPAKNHAAALLANWSEVWPGITISAAGLTAAMQILKWWGSQQSSAPPTFQTQPLATRQPMPPQHKMSPAVPISASASDWMPLMCVPSDKGYFREDSNNLSEGAGIRNYEIVGDPLPFTDLRNAEIYNGVW